MRNDIPTCVIELAVANGMKLLAVLINHELLIRF